MWSRNGNHAECCKWMSSTGFYHCQSTVKRKKGGEKEEGRFGGASVVVINQQGLSINDILYVSHCLIILSQVFGHFAHDFSVFIFQCSNGGCLIELAQQLAVIMVGKQMINNAQEIVIPKLKAWWHNKRVSSIFFITQSACCKLITNSSKCAHIFVGIFSCK